MCFDPQAQPPQPPRSGHLKDSERLTLTSEDGAQPAASLAVTDRTDAPGVVILPDRRGLHAYYERLAEAFAGAGVTALAVDLYSRSAGTAYRDDDFDFEPHMPQANTAHVTADAHAAALLLRQRDLERVYCLGFCFGGRAALLQAVEPGWSGVVGFYGFPARESPDGRSPLNDARAGSVQSPVLALFGAEDDLVGRDTPKEYDAALTAAGVDHTVVTYPSAGHSFFDRFVSEQADNCSDAWERILEFVG